MISGQLLLEPIGDGCEEERGEGYTLGHCSQRRESVVAETLPVVWPAKKSATNRHNNLGCARNYPLSSVAHNFGLYWFRYTPHISCMRSGIALGARSLWEDDMAGNSATVVNGRQAASREPEG